MSDNSLSTRITRIVQGPDTIDYICTHVASGGSLIDLCKTWDVPYGRIAAWIALDVERDRKYQASLHTRSEFRVEQIMNEYGGIAFAPISEDIRASDKIKALDSLARIDGMFRDKVEHTADVTLATLIERSMKPMIEGGGS